MKTTMYIESFHIYNIYMMLFERILIIKHTINMSIFMMELNGIINI